MIKHKSASSRIAFAAIAGLVLAVLAIAGWAVQPGATSADEEEPNSSITICKSTDPASVGDLVDFDTDIPGMNDIDLADGDCMRQDDLEPGKYEITEDKQTNWTLIAIVCEGIDADKVEAELAKRTVIVELKKGEDVTCTFFNEKEPTPTPEATPTATPEDTATPTDVPTDTPKNTPTTGPTNTPMNTPTDVPMEPTVAPPTEMPTDVPQIKLPDAGSGFGPDLVLSWYWYTLVGALLLIGLGVLIKPSYE